MTFKISLWHVVLASGVAVTSRQRWTTLLHMRTLYRSGLSWGLDTMFCVMEESCVAELPQTLQTDRQRKSCWQLHAGQQDSVAPWKRVQDMQGWAERESIRGSDFFLSLPISSPWSDPLWPGTSVLLASLSFYIFAPLSLPALSFSFAHNFSSIPLIWRASQSHSSTTSVSVCVALCARVCVFKKDHFHVWCLPK